MKKEDLMEIKMMFLEALNEYANGGVSTMSADNSEDEGTTEENNNDLGTSEGEGEENNSETDKGGNGNTAANSGGTPTKDGRPKPNVGVGVFGLR